MGMTVVVTRNVSDRFRGFLASCMCEIAPGVYTSPEMTKGVRERLWSVLSSWFEGNPGEGIVMTWADRRAPGGQAVEVLGSPRTSLARQGESILTWRWIDKEEYDVLAAEVERSIGEERALDERGEERREIFDKDIG